MSEMAVKTVPEIHACRGAAAAFPVAGWLREHGLRVTRSRVAMVELLRGAKKPLPLGDIHAALSAPGGDAGAACDFATVFRFLKVLEDKAMVDKQPWVDGTDRYELKPDASCPDGDGAHDHHHHYLVCRQCQRTEKIEQCLVSRLQTSIGRQTGYRELTHTLQFSGLCPRCQPAAG